LSSSPFLPLKVPARMAVARRAPAPSPSRVPSKVREVLPSKVPRAVARRPADATDPFPQPPVLPSEEAYKYWKGAPRWDEIWVPAEQREFKTMPVMPNFSVITEHICIGNMLFASNKEALVKAGITHVLTLTRRQPPQDVQDYFGDRWHRCVVSDTPQTPVSGEWEGASQHILKAERSGGKVFVHCRAGVSRASCFTIAHLIKTKGMTLQNAYQLIKSKRPIAHPNKGFLEQLRELEIQVHGKYDSPMIRTESLPYTLWERVEQVGLNDPIPSGPLCHELEKRVAQGYVDRYGGSNTYRTMDAGLGGKMELHVVELYCVGDFEWMDPIIVDVLYNKRPPDGNYIGRRQRAAAE